MIDVSYEDAVQRIHEETGLAIAEIQSRINAKLQQLSGLVSRDGAAHIVANELGVQLMVAAKQQGPLKIGEISLQSRNIVVAGRVVKKYDVRAFDKNGRSGRVASLLLGDETGVTRLVFWNDQVDVFEELKDGDILVVKNPFVKQSYMQDRLELQLNNQSSLTVNPEGVVVGQREFTPRQERPAPTQRYIKDLAGDEENVEIIATIVQVYDPRFFDSCPKCNRKLIGENQCPEHGEVVGGVNFSMSAFLDDGTGNIRASFWKQQAIKLTGKTENEFLKYRDDPTSFEDVKNDLLGEFVKVVGKVKRNETFDRLEFTAQLVFTDVDPAVELENLDKKFATHPTHHIVTETKTTVVRESEGKLNVEENMSVVEDDVVSLDDLEDLK